MMQRFALSFVIAMLALTAGAVAQDRFVRYEHASVADTAVPPDCARYFHAACKNRIVAAWLPYVADRFAPSNHQQARRIGFTDGFVYEGKIPDGTSLSLWHGMPFDGTAFVYGMAGPPRGRAAYDYAHAVAFYSQGCCSWSTGVLAAQVQPPPIRVVNRALAGLRTVHGIRLGLSPREVEARYAKTAARSVPGHAGFTMLSYYHMRDRSCGQYQNFVFSNDRLIYIELTDAC